MKVFFLVTSLFLLAACESNTSDKAMEYASPSRSGSGNGGEISLTATTRTRINVHESSIELLDRTEVTEEETIDGDSYFCGLETHPGEIWDYQAHENSLELINNGQLQKFNRIGNGTGLDGKWQFRENDELGASVGTIEISGNVMTLSLKCIFN